MRYDVAIVGAGPAGSTAAKVLAEKGISVLLLDKQTFPRDKPCGGGLPIRTVKRYKYIEENNLIDCYTHNICMHSTSLKYTVDIEKKEPLIAMVLRSTFDAGLVKIATQRGAQLQEGKTVVSMKTDEKDAHVLLQDGTTVDASFVIGADGMWSGISRQMGCPHDYNYAGVCVVEEYPVEKSVMDQLFGEGRCVHIHMNLLGLVGYGWVFPKKEHLNIGLGEFRHARRSNQQKVNLKTYYEKYLTLLKNSKIIPETIQPRALKGGIFPTLPVKKSYTQRTLVCGDAGGLTNPLTGEGIYYAMVSGEIAAHTIAHALENDLTQERALSVYQKEWMNDFGSDHKRFFRLSNGWRINNDNMIRIIGKDQKFVDIALSAILEPMKIKDIRFKIFRRLAYIYLKDRLGLMK